MRSLLLIAVFASTCTCGPAPIHIGPRIPDDTPSCTAACKRLLELGCEEGKPLEDGTTCTAFCEQTQENGHALAPSCVMTITSCDQVATKCGQGL